MIFIAKDHAGNVTGIVSAADIKSVNAYYQGKGAHPFKIEEFPIEKDRENEKEGYVTPLLITKEVNCAYFQSVSRQATVIIVDKSLK